MTVGAVGAWALPAAAAPSYTVDIDCLTSNDVYLVVPVDGSAAVTTTNCGAFDSSGAVVVGNLPTLTVTQAVAGHSAALLLGTDATTLADTPIRVYLDGGLPVPSPSPSGSVLNDTATVTIPQEAPPQFVADDSEGYCTLNAGDVATYGTAPLEILTSGTYTLRVVDVTPTSDDVNSQLPWHPIGDPVLMLYSGAFDPAHPSANLIDCDDDGQHVGSSASGTTVGGFFSEIGATLEPGVYTILVTTYTPVSAAEWSAGAAAGGEGGSQTFTPSAASVLVEVWGPDGQAVQVAAPLVTTGPANVTVPDGSTATFSAAASSYPSAAVQWQQSRDGGATWTDVAGATGTTLSFSAVLGESGYQFRAVFTAGEDVVASSAATLTVTAVLAATGSSSQAGLVLALVLIGAGAGFVGLSRRRPVVAAV